MEFVKRQTHSEGIVTFDTGVQCVQCSAKRLAPHLAEFFPSTVGRSLEFVAVKKFGKELQNGPRGELHFIFHSAKSQCMYLLIRLESNTSYVRTQR